MKVIVNGAAGHMGGVLINLIEAGTEGSVLAAGVDALAGGGTILKSLDEFTGEADVLIDFSHHTAVRGLLKWAVGRKMPVVIATTGHDEAEKALIKEAAEHIPVFWAANFSIGIAFLAETAKKAAKMFPDADIEIVEKHHNRKIDAPSGTALMLADAIREARPDAVLVEGRSGMRKREKNDIGISSLRMGNLAGTHEVILTTATQSITLSHEVYDRALFAEGALYAAKSILGKPAGLYDMKTVISET